MDRESGENEKDDLINPNEDVQLKCQLDAFIF